MDHPRSRGVYARTGRPITLYGGSSPLARGLLRELAAARGFSGIIPARAGFTDPSSPNPCSPRGSSPLARGLHPLARRSHSADRIIPARAGFTSAIGSSPEGSRDHPRSRGVYDRRIRRRVRRRGSSPLARGLRSRYTRRAVVIRIIPARAGFTPRGRAALHGPPDHPRSRGVYACIGPAEAVAYGSSPLARGLLAGCHATSDPDGIIPARAGFTPVGDGDGEGVGDHPRSRGVYRAGATSGLAATGSSPLARGLREGHGVGRVGVGIIPARAGFTEATPLHHRHRQDHPRSRGVYGLFRFRRILSGGSSPLARGLLFRPHHHPGRRRIIPARAGFT